MYPNSISYVKSTRGMSDTFCQYKPNLKAHCVVIYWQKWNVKTLIVFVYYCLKLRIIVLFLP